MPIRVGNIMEAPLAKQYFENDLFKALRDPDRISHGCEKCFYAQKCSGGLKCLSYAITGSPFNADPGCWLTKKEEAWE